MPELQPPSSVVPRAAIERPACPRCHAQMMLACIVPAFLGTDLRTFECAACNHVLRTLCAYEDPMQSISDADPFAPYRQESRHDHGPEEKAHHSKRLHPAKNSD
jgi:hypothetical protein